MRLIFPKQNTHCIGDRANGMFIDLMEKITKQVNLTALRPRVEHAQIIAPGDFSRMSNVEGEPSSLYMH